MRRIHFIMTSDERVHHTPRKKSGKAAERPKGSRRQPEADVSAADVESPPKNPPDIETLRRARLDHLDKSPDERRTNMKYVGEVVTTSPATKEDIKRVKKISERKRRHKATDTDRKHRPRKVRVAESRMDDDDESEYVYRRTEDVGTNDAANSKTLVSSAATAVPRRTQTGRTAARRIEKDQEQRRTPQRRQTEPVRRRNSFEINERGQPQR